jgi:hypothetical protein
MNEKLAVELVQKFQDDKNLQDKIDFSIEHPWNIPYRFSKLKSVDKLYVLEILFKEYWLPKKDWYVEGGRYSAAMNIVLELFPVKKLNENLQVFMMGNAIDLIKRAKQEHDIVIENGIRGVDYRQMDIDVISQLFPCIESYSEELKRDVLSFIDGENLPDSISFPIESALRDKYLFKYYDKYSKTINDKYLQLDINSRNQIFDLFEFINKNCVSGKAPAAAWLKKAEKYISENVINFNLIIDLLEESLKIDDACEVYYWQGGRYQDYHSGNVVNVKNEKIYKTVFSLFIFCKDKNVISKLDSFRLFFKSVALKISIYDVKVSDPVARLIGHTINCNEI